ncbi:hypothetical protein ACFYT3_31450 [Nocardia amikacinitolerans]|uniref:hypothetical protein n=1 Tax=Nocardia amikacinitolerans TaxID=756689 RepID=UPI0036A80B57
MEILSKALPGFRDLRAPLTAGYLWLAFAWLLLTPDFKVRPADELAGSVYDLAHSVGPIWLAVAVSTGAYLIGAISQFLSDAARVVLMVARRHRNRPGPSTPPSVFDALGFDPSNLLHGSKAGAENQLEEFARFCHLGLFERRRPRADAVPEDPDQSLPPLAERATKEYERILHRFATEWGKAIRHCLREPELPATVLVADQPELFSEVDRLRAEGQLRLAVVPPLIALTVLLGLRSAVWSLMILGIFALAWQGVQRLEESRQLVIDAITTNRVASPAARRFADWVDAVLPQEINRAKARMPKEELDALAESWAQQPRPPRAET